MKNSSPLIHDSANSIKSMLGILILLLIITSCGVSSGDSDTDSDMDWHLFRANAGLNGSVDISLPEKPGLLWAYKTGQRTASSLVIDNGTSYWCSRKGLITGVDIHGQLAFSYDLKTPVEATPMINDSALYIGRIDGFLSAISLTKKDTLWSYETLGQILASPNIVQYEGEEAIVFGSYDNYFYCLNKQTGSLLKRFESGYYINGAAALWNKHALFGGCDAWLRIINCETGESTDSLELDEYIPASPSVYEDDCYVGDYAGNIYHLSLDKGKIKNHKKVLQPASDNESFLSIPAINAQSVFVYAGNRHLVSIERSTGNINFKFMLKGDAGESAPAVCKDKLIVCTETGIVSILDNRSGELLWEYDTGERITSSPAVIGGYFMILTVKGTLLCFGSQAN
ncbi:PQQ-binding-like beta-propeller repeat protein [Carboxylicivirga marina]|uniref:outer membrane protein assembly factor BamB family protein n=1 Tax=Carboxylicivirga marina TaxID=2800988 RepID=UPI002597E706|nr:PQQ-binding-like beta-propeller repeat protein [uncultured Carboxylicivirga sp.]